MTDCCRISDNSLYVPSCHDSSKMHVLICWTVSSYSLPTLLTLFNCYPYDLYLWSFIGMCGNEKAAKDTLLECQDLSQSLGRFGNSALLSNATSVCHLLWDEWDLRRSTEQQSSFHFVSWIFVKTTLLRTNFRRKSFPFSDGKATSCGIWLVTRRNRSMDFLYFKC